MEPVIVVTRHPDYSDEISVHGTEAQVIYLDLGSSFDTTPDDIEQAREWAMGTWDEVRHLSPGHPARDEVREVIRYTVESYFTDEKLTELLDAVSLGVEGAELRFDDDGNPIVKIATCGTCGRSWNDAAVSGVTPVPSGRCPFEYEHSEGA